MKNEINRLEDLSLADLMALHTNYWLSRGTGMRFMIITDKMFDAIEKEIGKRLSVINFKTTPEKI